MVKSSHVETLIVGGGVAGLSSHYFIPGSLVLERGPVVGGGCRVVTTKNGHTYSLGPRKLRYRPETDDVVSSIISKLEIDVLITEESSLVWYGGRYVRFPFQHNLVDLSVKDMVSCVLSYIARPGGRVENFEQWARSKYGNKIAEAVVLPHSERSWKRSARDIGMRATGKVMEGGLAELLKGLVVGQNIKDRMVYLEGGVSTLMARMASLSPGIVVNADVKRGGIDTERHEVRYSLGLKDCVVTYDHLISTVPLPAFHHLLSQKVRVPDRVKMAMELLDYNILFLVYVLVNAEDFTGPRNSRMVYYPEHGPAFHRISFPEVDGVDVRSGMVSIVAEVTMDRKYRRLVGNESFSHDLTSKVVSDMVRVGLIKGRTDPEMTNVSVINPGYILFDMNYDEAISVVREYFDRVLGVKLIGRFAEWNNLEIDTTFKRAKELSLELV